MKPLISIAILLLATASFAFAQDDDASFSNCATTRFKIANKKAIVSADVIKYTKLGAGQGTMDCMALCRAMDECGGYNFLQRSKWCYILSGTGRFRRKRRSGWASGIKTCVDHSSNDPWDNSAYDSQDAKATNVYAIADLNQNTFVATWTPPYLGARYGGELTYKFKCGLNDPEKYSCDQKGWSSRMLTTNSISLKADRDDAYEAFRQLFPGAKCYVEVYLSGLKMSCSKAAVVQIIPTPWLTVTQDCRDVTASWKVPYDGITSWELECVSANGGTTVSQTFSAGATSGSVSGLSISRNYTCSLTAYDGSGASLTTTAPSFTTVSNIPASCYCDTGYYDTYCDYCDKGYTGNGALCTACAKGYYKDVTGNNIACSSCDTGYTTNVTGSDAASDCNVCVAGFEDNSGSCDECGVGFYKNTEGPGPCTACAAGKTTTSTGSTGINFCVCDAGYTGGGCTACAVGYYKSGTGSGSCTQCSTGYTTSGTGSTASTDCNICSAGYEPSGSTCVQCSVGTYKTSAGNSTCTACSSGFTTSGTGKTASSQCNVCAAGYGGNGSTCTACSAGSYKASSGNTSCSTCGSGFTNTGTGNTVCDQCDIGFGGDGTTCTACTSGTDYKDTVGNTNCLDCSANGCTTTCTTTTCSPGITP